MFFSASISDKYKEVAADLKRGGSDLSVTTMATMDDTCEMGESSDEEEARKSENPGIYRETYTILIRKIKNIYIYTDMYIHIYIYIYTYNYIQIKRFRV